MLCKRYPDHNTNDSTNTMYVGKEMLWRIYGPIQDKGCWPHRWNSENYSLYKDLNIVDVIWWVGRVMGMEDERISEQCFLMGNFTITNHITRPVGKPRTRWEAIIKRDMSHTGCPRRNVKYFRRVFLMLNYTDITQNTYIQNWTVMEIMAREKCGHLAFPHTVPLQLLVH